QANCASGKCYARAVTGRPRVCWHVRRRDFHRSAHQRSHRPLEPMDTTAASTASSAAPATACSRWKRINARLLWARLGASMMSAALLVLCGTASAQSTYGLIEGRITDTTGAALPGATVTVTQPTTGFVRVVVSNELGLYRVLNLHPADYDITVERGGFATVTYASLKIGVGQAVALNVGMEVGSLAVVMEVAPPAVNAVTSEISATIDTRHVNELPLNGRDFTRFALFAPGVVQTAGLVASIAVNATSVSQNNFLLDGIDATRIDDSYPSNGFERGSRLQTASVESIEEMRVLTSNYPAEYGRAAGAVISAVTKSGTNAFHGSGYTFFRNDRFDARNFFDGPEKPAFDMKQFGGSLSGPIR